METIMQRLFASAGLCLLLAATTAPAMARDIIGEVTNVHTDGVDFNDISDVKAFYGRLEKAAHKVCDIAGNSLEVREDNADCRARALDGAVAELRKPSLSEIHAKRTGEEPQLADARRQRTW
jgi:UrcA family protein